MNCGQHNLGEASVEINSIMVKRNCHGHAVGSALNTDESNNPTDISNILNLV